VVQQITEVRRIIVQPRETEIDEYGVEHFVGEGKYSNGEPLPPRAMNTGTVQSAAAPGAAPAPDPLSVARSREPPDPLTLARSRLDKMRGAH
jgi:hypothetical protein